MAAFTRRLITFSRAPFLSVQEGQAHEGDGELPLTRRGTEVPGGKGVLLGSSSAAKILSLSEMGWGPASEVEFLCWKGRQMLWQALPGMHVPHPPTGWDEVGQ